jgi:hypothetical protein
VISLTSTKNGVPHFKLPLHLNNTTKSKALFTPLAAFVSERLPLKAMIPIYTALSPDQEPISLHEARSTFKRAAAP